MDRCTRVSWMRLNLFADVLNGKCSEQRAQSCLAFTINKVPGFIFRPRFSLNPVARDLAYRDAKRICGENVRTRHVVVSQ